jgi:hypothetical protein
MFANVSVQQRRLPTADFLLKEGQSASWVLGAMIITITTSRCSRQFNFVFARFCVKWKLSLTLN